MANLQNLTSMKSHYAQLAKVDLLIWAINIIKGIHLMKGEHS